MIIYQILIKGGAMAVTESESEYLMVMQHWKDHIDGKIKDKIMVIRPAPSVEYNFRLSEISAVIKNKAQKVSNMPLMMAQGLPPGMPPR